MTLGRLSQHVSSGPSVFNPGEDPDKHPIPFCAAIIPAYNEAELIGGVLDVLHQVACLDEIIIVDDGSVDATFEVAREATMNDRRMQLLRHARNEGKGQAFFTAMAATQATILLMLDADLTNLKPQQVMDLMRPVLENQADMTLGLFRGGRWNTDLSHRLTPWLTGQRCLRTELCKSISQRAAAGYGLETAITVAAHRGGWRCQRVSLEGVAHPAGEAHRGFWRGLRNRLAMYGNILSAWYFADGVGEMFRRRSDRKRVIPKRRPA